ncbi:MAG TPA: hypothetical protein ENJ53_03820, partial [Phaeodactylibacter sp.]|nr:hypothetical protein [Phaeodactylibacter sp.]
MNETNNITMKLNHIIFWVAGILLFAYSTIRAVNIPMTVDESTTFLVYVQKPLIDVFLNNPVNTNNHFLNTFLIKLSIAIFGVSDLSVRLPSLMGHLFYIIFSFKLLQAISNRTIVILLGIVLLHLNPYFIDFFGLARGYSLSWGFMMASMYYLYRYIQDAKNKYINWSFVFAALSVYSILIGLNYFLALIIAFNVVFLRDFLKEKNKSYVFYFLKKNIAALVSSLILFVILAYPISRARANNEFYGEKTTFFKATIFNLVEQSFFGKKYFAPDFLLVVMGVGAAIYLTVMIYGFRDFFRKNISEIRMGGLVFGVLFTVACWSTIAQFYLLGVPFLTFRTALIYVPLFAIIPVFFFSFFDKKKGLQFILCILPIMGLTYHFSKCANIVRVREWWFDANTKDVLTYFLENEKLDKGKQVTFGVRGWISPSFHYYEKTWHLEDRVKMVRRD